MRNVLIKSLKELSQDKKTFINIFILFLLCFGIGGAIATMGINIQKDTIIQNQDVNSFKDIFLNNIKVSLLIFFTGFFTIGLVPMIIMFLNGLNFTAAFIFFSLTESFVFSIKHSIFHAPIELLGFYFAFVPSLYLYT
ncbi:stage II sporulation protein M, partial [Bacillus pseudomycoides]|uniref:stage II sporulation protein M n=2 Tax=Bacillus TaxID=1386 RepID=UPI002FFDED11